jgi:hypothetical protein
MFGLGCSGFGFEFGFSRFGFRVSELWFVVASFGFRFLVPNTALGTPCERWEANLPRDVPRIPQFNAPLGNWSRHLRNYTNSPDFLSVEYLSSYFGQSNPLFVWCKGINANCIHSFNQSIEWR